MLFYSNNINIGLMLNAMHFFSPLTTASEAVWKMGVWGTSTEISQALNNKTLQQMDGNLRKPAMSPSHPGTYHTEITVEKGGEGYVQKCRLIRCMLFMISIMKCSPS